MIAYLDTSVIVRKLLEQPDLHPDWGAWETAATSALTAVEASRALHRMRLQKRLTDPEVSRAFEILRTLLDGVGRIPVSETVLERAGHPFPTAIRTLDAIHLASALLWMHRERKPIAFLTHDAELEIAARAVGFRARLT